MGTPVIDDVQRRARLVRRHHLARTAADAVQVARDLVALHSSDPATPPLSLWARVPDATIEGYEQAMYQDRALWRLHAMRRTLWVVATADAPVVLAAASADVADAERRRALRWIAEALPDVDPAVWAEDVIGQVRSLVADGVPRSTTELSAAIPELRTPITVGSGRWTGQTPVGSRLLFLAAMDGHLVRGPSGGWRASQYRWADPVTWFRTPVPDRPDPDVARAELARRWLVAFGPGTTEDLRWWTGWTVVRTRRALADVGAVEVATADGSGWVLPGDEGPVALPDGPVAALLPGLDPTAMGWKARAFHLDPAHVTRLFDRNGNAGPTAWVDGRVVGGWAQRPDGEVVLELLADVGADARALLDVEAARLTRWLDGTVVTPRFPSPSSRALMG